MEYRTDSEYVQIEQVQFLVLMRPHSDITAWSFLDLVSLNTMYDAVMEMIDDVDLLQVACSASVDDEGFSMITLSTINMEVFNLFRAGIRDYTGIPGHP